MMTKKLLLTSCLLISCFTLSTAQSPFMSQDEKQETLREVKKEIERNRLPWKNMYEKKGALSGLGLFLKEYAALLALPVLPLTAWAAENYFSQIHHFGISPNERILYATGNTYLALFAYACVSLALSGIGGLLEDASAVNEQAFRAPEDVYQEQQKWQYLCHEFSFTLREDERFLAKLGSCMKNYAAFFALFAVPLGAYLGVKASYQVENYRQASYWPTFIYGAREMTDNEKMRIGCAVTCISVFVYMIAYDLCQAAGGLLETKFACCKEALSELFRNWDKHEPHIPDTIKTLLTNLKNDFNTGTGTFNTLSEAEAHMIVENILLTGEVLQTQLIVS